MIIGAGTHLRGVSTGIAQLQAAGVNSIRDDAFVDVWRNSNPYAQSKNVVQWALTQNSVCILTAHLGQKPDTPEKIAEFCEFSKWMVLNVPTNIFEVMNEWWHPGTGAPSDAVSYMALQRAAYKAIKAVRPDCVVLGASGAPTGATGRAWLADLQALGLDSACDGVSIHPYNYSSPAPHAGNAMVDTRNLIASMTKPIYITEFGWPTYAGVGGQTEQFQAVQTISYLLRCLRDDRIKGAWIYDFHDDGADPANREHNFGLVHNDYTPKPAFRALKTLIEARKTGWVMVGLSIDSSLVTNWKAGASTLSPPVREALRDVLQAMRAGHAAIAKPATVNGQSRVFIRAPVPTDALIPLLSERTTQITVTSIKTVGGKQLGDDVPIRLDAALESTHTTGVTLPGYAGW